MSPALSCHSSCALLPVARTCKPFGAYGGVGSPGATTSIDTGGDNVVPAASPPSATYADTAYFCPAMRPVNVAVPSLAGTTCCGDHGETGDGAGQICDAIRTLAPAGSPAGSQLSVTSLPLPATACSPLSAGMVAGVPGWTTSIRPTAELATMRSPASSAVTAPNTANTGDVNCRVCMSVSAPPSCDVPSFARTVMPPSGEMRSSRAPETAPTSPPGSGASVVTSAAVSVVAAPVEGSIRTSRPPSALDPMLAAIVPSPNAASPLTAPE